MVFGKKFRQCLVFGKFEGKCKGKKIERKSKRKKKVKENKNRVKDDKLFLFTILNSFYLFELINIKIK